MNDPDSKVSRGIKSSISRRLVFFGKLSQETIQAISVVPTSWQLFITFCGYLGVIDLLGPYFRYAIFYWKLYTRKFWEWILQIDFLSIRIDLNDADKDALTFSAFFIIFGFSSIKAYIDILRSQSDVENRKINWRTFPIASVISALTVALVATDLMNAPSAASQASIPLFASGVFFVALMSFFYYIAAFPPFFVTYSLAYIASLFGLKNYFKILFPIIALCYTAPIAYWVSTHAAEVRIHAGMAIVGFTTLIVYFFSLWMPISQPYKLIKMLLIALLIGAIAIASYLLENLKYATITSSVNSSSNQTLSQEISKTCKKNLSMAFITSGIAVNSGYKTRNKKACDCLGKMIVDNEELRLANEIARDFDMFMKLDSGRSKRYFAMCIQLA